MNALRFLGALLLGLLLVAGSLALGLFLLLEGNPEAQAALWEAVRARPMVPLFTGLLLLGALSLLLYPPFLGYLALTRALGQESEVLLAHPGHRLTPRGPWELRHLARLINRLAEEKERLEQRLEEEAAQAKDLVEAERERLARVLAQLPQGVVLSDERGLVLLYNPKARALLGEGLGVGKSLFGLLDRSLLLHAQSLPQAAFLVQGPKGPLRLKARALEEGFLLLLEEALPEGPSRERLHRLKDKAAGVRALVEVLERETTGEAKRLLQVAREALDEIQGLLQDLAPSPHEEVLAQDLLRLLAGRLEARLALTPGWALDPEAEGLLVQADTFALAEGLAKTLEGTEEVFLRGEAEGEGLFRLTVLLPREAPRPHPPLAEAAEATGSLWREGSRLVLLLPARKAPPEALKEAPAPRALVYDLTLLQVPPGLEDVPLDQLLYTAFDLETTGLDPEQDAVVALAGVHVLGRRVLRQEVFEALVNPGRPISPAATAVHGLTAEMLRDKPPLEAVLPAFRAFVQDTVLVAHNGAFDLAFLRRAGLDQPPLLDTLLLAQLLFPDLKDYRLEALAHRFGVPATGRHTALGDALMTAEVFVRMQPLLFERGLKRLWDVVEACRRLPLARLRY